MSDWIPVSERLPELKDGRHYSESVLVFEDYSAVGGAKSISVDRRDRHGWERSDRVTHWMPLPKPPEQPL